jgi:hypothetical protein
MKKELDEALVKDFPLLYCERYWDMSRTCMIWGFPGSGWEPIIRELSSKLESLIKEQKKTLSECQCGCDISRHEWGEYCTTIFRVPYRVGRVFYVGPIWNKWSQCKTWKAKRTYLTTRLDVHILWRLRRWINNYILTPLFNTGLLVKKVPCNCDGFHLHHARAKQVKEKYGELRFYLGGRVTKEMYDLVDEASIKSQTTCEWCGKPGRLRGEETGRNWILTLCDHCNTLERRPADVG